MDFLAHLGHIFRVPVLVINTDLNNSRACIILPFFKQLYQTVGIMRTVALAPSKTNVHGAHQKTSARQYRKHFQKIVRD